MYVPPSKYENSAMTLILLTLSALKHQTWKK